MCMVIKGSKDLVKVNKQLLGLRIVDVGESMISSYWTLKVSLNRTLLLTTLPLSARLHATTVLRVEMQQT